MNPHGHDTELWLFERGIGASGYVRATPGAVVTLLLDARAAGTIRMQPATLARVKAGDADESLAALYFQYGRYLLIASSRPGGQPAAARARPRPAQLARRDGGPPCAHGTGRHIT